MKERRIQEPWQPRPGAVGSPLAPLEENPLLDASMGSNQAMANENPGRALTWFTPRCRGQPALSGLMALGGEAT